jgi:hypothetical protein
MESNTLYCLIWIKISQISGRTHNTKVRPHLLNQRLTVICVWADTSKLQGCFVSALYEATPLPTTDLIRHSFLSTLLLVTHVQAECQLVFKTVCKYTIDQHSFFYNSHVKSNSAHVCRREFQQKFPGAHIPAWSTIHYLVNKFKTKGSVLDKKIKKKKMSHTD